MFDNYMLGKMLKKIKELIGIEKLDDNKTLIDADHKLPDDITLKNVLILITFAIKDEYIFYR